MKKEKWFVNVIGMSYILLLLCCQMMWKIERKTLQEVYGKKENQAGFYVEVSQIQGKVRYEPETIVSKMAITMLPYERMDGEEMAVYQSLSEKQKETFWKVLLIISRTNLYAEWDLQGYPDVMQFPVDKLCIENEICGNHIKEAKEKLRGDALIAQKATQGIIVCFRDAKNVMQGYQTGFIPYFFLSAGKTRALQEGNIKYPKVTCKEDTLSRCYMSWKRYEKKDFFERIRNCFQMDSQQLADFSLERDDSEYVEHIYFLPKEQELEVGEFLKAFGLSSSCFYIEEQNQDILIRVKGIGHGFGFCIHYGMILAKNDCTYEEIIQFFLQDAFLERKYGV